MPATSFLSKLLFTFMMVVVISAMVKLGFWQWQRAQEKQQRLHNYQAQAQQSLVLSELLNGEKHAFKRLTLNRIDAFGPQLYLDNQLNEGVAGYVVVQSVRINNMWLLIRLGWVKSEAREHLPVAPSTLSLPQVFRLRPFSTMVLLKDVHWSEDKAPHWRIQSLDRQRIQKLLGQAIAPWYLDVQLKLSEAELVAMPPQKHRAYAWQWWTMSVIAALMTILFIRSTLKQGSD